MRPLVLAFIIVVSNVPLAQAQHHPLVGTWRSSAISQAGEQKVEVAIQANGTYSQQWRGRNILNTYTGRWRVMDGGIVRFDIDDWQPKEWCGPLGCTIVLQALRPASNSGSESLPSDLIDGGSPLVYQRARSEFPISRHKARYSSRNNRLRSDFYFCWGRAGLAGAGLLGSSASGRQ